MNVLSKKVDKNRKEEIIIRASELFISAAILTADDIWGVDEKTTDQFINAFSEIINGYGEEGGIEAIRQELKDRGIEVKI